jgi:hypothetical protein
MVVRTLANGNPRWLSAGQRRAAVEPGAASSEKVTTPLLVFTPKTTNENEDLFNASFATSTGDPNAPAFITAVVDGDLLTAIASVRSLHFKKRAGGAGRCLFGSSCFLESCDFSLQGRDALIDFLHGKVVETLSDLVRRCRLPGRRAK